MTPPSLTGSSGQESGEPLHVSTTDTYTGTMTPPVPRRVTVVDRHPRTPRTRSERETGIRHRRTSLPPTSTPQTGTPHIFTYHQRDDPRRPSNGYRELSRDRLRSQFRHRCPPLTVTPRSLHLYVSTTRTSVLSQKTTDLVVYRETTSMNPESRTPSVVPRGETSLR